jgi:murein DD-endopeptidase MepM/ murein hydrolase activator NlpD
MLTNPATKLCWHAGDGATGLGNTYEIAIEVNPRWSDGDYQTTAELIRDIRKVHGDLPLNPHRKWTTTQCPGVGDLTRLDRLARAGGTTMVFTRHPVDSYISQPWGANKTGGITPDPNGTDMQRLVYEYGNYQPYGHDGIDYGCPIGTPVYAPGPGVIEWSGWGQDMPQHIALKYGFVYGPGGWPSGILVCMRMDNSDIGCYMAHLSESYYEPGQWVNDDIIVGLSGNSGRSGGPHCHFSAIRFPVNYSDGLYSRVNPLPLFSSVTQVQIRPGGTGDPATVETPKEWYEMPIPESDLKAIARAVHHAQLPIGGKNTVSHEMRIIMTDKIANEIRAQVASQSAQVKGLIGAISALSKGEPFDEAKLLAGVQAAASAGVKDAISSIETTVNIKETP